MDLIVCIKEVPDTESSIVASGGKLNLEALKFVVSPFDEYGVEEALRIKERVGGTVKILCLGQERARKAIESCLALGADDAVHIWDEGFDVLDPYDIAFVLSKEIAKHPYDIIFTGKQGVDYDHGQVGIMLAELLGIPFISKVSKLDVDHEKRCVRAERDGDEGREAIESSLPIVITTEKGLNEPRYASLKGIMAVKKKTIEKRTASDLGIDKANFLAEAQRIVFEEFNNPPPKKGGIVIKEEFPQNVKELVRLLKEEAKVI